MKEYPSISHQIDRGLQVYAWDKHDGTQIRTEWSRKNGFYKFGIRSGLINETHPEFGEAKGLILETYSEPLGKIFRDQRWNMAAAFFEFFGPNSFAGLHADEPHRVILFDVSPDKKGIEPPNSFLRLFESVGIPKMVYLGKANHEFEQGIRDGTWPGVTFEGVVCKGIRKGRHLTMFKIKSQAWIDKLRQRYAGNEAMIAKLM